MSALLMEAHGAHNNFNKLVYYNRAVKADILKTKNS